MQILQNKANSAQRVQRLATRIAQQRQEVRYCNHGRPIANIVSIIRVCGIMRF